MSDPVMPRASVCAVRARRESSLPIDPAAFAFPGFKVRKFE
jgi:hypothetical protein